jgi:hypothetical protein
MVKEKHNNVQIGFWFGTRHENTLLIKQPVKREIKNKETRTKKQ